jgi:hypothetical protein
MALDWWRCNKCGRKVQEADVEWKLTGPKATQWDVRAREQPYCPKCALLVTPKDQWYPNGDCVGYIGTLKDGKLVCGGCGAEFLKTRDGKGWFHP